MSSWRRRGQSPIFLLPVLLILLFVFGFGAYFVKVIQDDVAGRLNDNLDSEESHAVVSGTTSYVDGLTSVFLIVLVGVIGFAIVAGVVRQEHPVLFVVALLLLIVMVVVGIILGNAAEKLQDSSQMANATDHYSVMNPVLNSFPTTVLVIILIGAIVMYVRFKG